MNISLIEQTQNSPGIDYDVDTKKLSIDGRCLAHKTFWEPLYPAIEILAAHNLLEVISINVEYFNTAAKKHIFDILATHTNTLPDGTLHVTWIREESDEDIEEVGETIENGTKGCKHIKERENIIIAA